MTDGAISLDILKETVEAEQRYYRKSLERQQIAIGILILLSVVMTTIGALGYIRVDRLGHSVERIAAANRVHVLEHRERSEACVVQYLQKITKAADEDTPLTAVEACEQDNVTKIKSELERARKELKELK